MIARKISGAIKRYGENVDLKNYQWWQKFVADVGVHGSFVDKKVFLNFSVRSHVISSKDFVSLTYIQFLTLYQALGSMLQSLKKFRHMEHFYRVARVFFDFSRAAQFTNSASKVRRHCSQIWEITPK